MKKFLFLLFALSATLGVNAQKIIGDNTKDGLRYIGTDAQVCRNFKDKLVLSASLSASVFKGKTTFNFVPNLTYTSPCETPKNGKLLIKLFDDSVIELTTAAGDKQTVRDVHNINGMVYSDYTMRPLYEITEDQLQQIISKGVKKIRIETSPIIYDNEFKKDKIGKALGDRYELLKQALSATHSFSDGF